MNVSNSQTQRNDSCRLQQEHILYSEDRLENTHISSSTGNVIVTDCLTLIIGIRILKYSKYYVINMNYNVNLKSFFKWGGDLQQT